MTTERQKVGAENALISRASLNIPIFSIFLILADNKTKAEAKTELPEPILKDKYLERFLEQFKVLFEGSLEESRRSILTPYVPEIFFQYTPNEVVSFSTSKANFKK